MRLDNFIQTAMNNVLKNPVLSVLRDINFSSFLKQSNFIKRDIGKSPYLIILHFLYMFIINKRISTFMKQSSDSYKKDVYYRLLKNSKYNWRKLVQAQEIVKRNKDLEQIILMLRVYTKKQLGFICESWVINISQVQNLVIYGIIKNN